ncbi:MAG: helicase-related protein [Erysipelotrichaceae bacterium]|nr:helicase-related protein [Erysipelotrichaceae bacterium]
MQCPRCLNEDPHYFYFGSTGYYCRKCVNFKRILLDDVPEASFYYDGRALDGEYQLAFNLTPAQLSISNQLADMIDKTDVLVHAACGAGKTEIVMQSIRKYLEKGKSVGFTTPRRQVVIELGKRLSQAFSHIEVVWVCEGYTVKTSGDLIVCTTHQLYRYPKKFDLLILDEPDAFPYKGNDVLKGIVRNSCRGHIIYLTATPDQELSCLPTLSLFRRPHGYDLTVPRIVYCLNGLSYLVLFHWLRKHRRALIFVPTIKMSLRLAKLLHVPAFNSKTPDKDQLIDQFRQGKWPFLVCTTVLERGITISNIDVCIFNGEHVVFDVASLVQIMGRIGRDINYPTGEGLIICHHRERKIDECLQTIRMMNA